VSVRENVKNRVLLALLFSKITMVHNPINERQAYVHTYGAIA